nr:tRNA adenosine(34) deaminase TadA [Spiribacter curvatus]
MGVNDTVLMERALRLAQQAAEAGEVPVGAVLVRQAAIVGEGANAPIERNDPSAHAEIVALRDAGARLGTYRFPGTTLYVTLEPCPMCVGALIHARVERIIYGAADPKTGACGGATRQHDDPSHNHQLSVTGGVMAEPAATILRTFFRARRER